MTTATYFAFDTETSGFEPSEGAEILSYAYMVLDENLDVLAQRQRFFFPKGPVDPGAAAVNGYTPELWASRGALRPEALSVHIQYDLEKDVPHRVAPLGHNVAFDLKFFNAYGPRAELRKKLDYHGMDTMLLARALDQAFGQKGEYKLTALCARYEIELLGAHDSLNDIDATVKLYRKLIRAIRRDDELPAPAAPSPRPQGGFFRPMENTLVFTRGKYAGNTLEEISDTSYLTWVLGAVELSDGERALVKAACTR